MRLLGSLPLRIAGVCVLGLFVVSLVALSVRGRQPSLPVGALPNPTGTFVHAGSGLEFPGFLAGFARRVGKRYDGAGSDVAVGYLRTLEGARVEATVFVFPPRHHDTGVELSPEEELATEIDEMSAGKAGLREVARGQAVEARGGKPVTVSTVEFEYEGRRPSAATTQRLVTLLSSMRVGAWQIEYRVTVEREGRDSAWAAVDSLVSALGLPRTGSAELGDPAPRVRDG